MAQNGPHPSDPPPRASALLLYRPIAYVDAIESVSADFAQDGI